MTRHRHRATAVAEAFVRIMSNARPVGECLLYGPGNRSYPVRVAGRLERASRVVFEAVHGRPPAVDTPYVLHSCIDRRNCARASHLREGTAADNSADMVEQGRSLRGERHHKARLTNRSVRLARRQRERGASVTFLAARHGVGISTMSAALLGRTWGHVA